MSRGDGIKDIIRLGLLMQESFQGLSLQDIQDEFDVSRSTAIRMKRILEEVFEVQEVENYYSPVKKWRLSKNRLLSLLNLRLKNLLSLKTANQ